MKIQVETVHDISDQQFRTEYLPKQVPLILNDCIEHWPARTKWDLDYFENRFPDKQLNFSNQQWILGDFIKQLKEGVKPIPYLNQVKFHSQFPELASDVGDLRFTNHNLLNSKLLPKATRIPLGIRAVFIGGEGSGFASLHWDYTYLHVFISQIYGEKDFVIFAPEDTPYLYPNPEMSGSSLIQDFNAFDPQQYPDVASASPIYLTLKPGETLFIPAGWWHSTKMRGISISVAESWFDKTIWHKRSAWFSEAFARDNKPLWKRVVFNTYMQFLYPFLK